MLRDLICALTVVVRTSPGCREGRGRKSVINEPELAPVTALAYGQLTECNEWGPRDGMKKIPNSSMQMQRAAPSDSTMQ